MKKIVWVSGLVATILSGIVGISEVSARSPAGIDWHQAFNRRVIPLDPVVLCRATHPLSDGLKGIHADPYCCSVTVEEDRLSCLQENLKGVRGFDAVIRNRFFNRIASALSRWGCDAIESGGDGVGITEAIALTERDLSCEFRQLDLDLSEVESSVKN
jgi:hypothetical protein